MNAKWSRNSQKPISFDSLPYEVLLNILYYIPPLDILSNVQRSSQQLFELCNEPLLWRHHCKSQFKYWDSKHRIRQKFLGSVGDVDWKSLYLHRVQIDSQTTSILDSILQHQVNRIKKFNSIAAFGYDAKDTLLRHCHTSENADDVLSRRYYATAVLDHVHRSKALAQWQKLGMGVEISLERALGAFDLFILHDQHGDLSEIADLFDGLYARLRIEYPNLDQFSIRQKALAVVAFLRSHNLTGIATDLAYRDLQNNYIGIALQDHDHPSLPLISVSIFCSLARRLGLDARCCGIPNHVHAMVYPTNDESLDGHSIQGQEDNEPMYLDPFRSHQEVFIENLEDLLGSWGIERVEIPGYISASTTCSLVLRTSRNILATVHDFRAHGGNTENTGHPTICLYANPFADMDNAFYSALWANFMLSSPLLRSGFSNQRQFIPLILERFEHLYPMDASLIEQYICPIYNDPSNAENWELHEALRVVKAADQSPKQIRVRHTCAAQEKVRYKVGQVFRHKRYAYIAVITGWDIECGMNSDWIAHNNVDSLSRGRQQSFYHALVEDTSVRYVAEENIEIIEPEVPTSLMNLAGRFFKRWDVNKRVFVSNIRDEYPED